jgi:aminoglycoside 2'-N-acetyltransferase I
MSSTRPTPACAAAELSGRPEARVEIRSFAESAVPDSLRSQVLALREQAWPTDVAERDGPAGAQGHDPALRPVSLLLIDDGTVVAALDILSKDLVHAGQHFAASGLSTVVTDQAQRGRGYGRRLVSAARDQIERSGADLGIFTCDRPLQAFYEAAGWSVLTDSVLVGGTPDAPFASDQFDKVVLVAFFSARAQRAADSFHGCRIELYPGSWDKLW